jgi:cytochrome c peroxidase
MKKLSKYPILLFLYSAAALFILSHCKGDKQQPVSEDLGSVKKKF